MYIVELTTTIDPCLLENTRGVVCVLGAYVKILYLQVGGSTKKIPKTEEIQSVEYRFRIDLETGSELGESARSEADIEEPGFNSED